MARRNATDSDVYNRRAALLLTQIMRRINFNWVGSICGSVDCQIFDNLVWLCCYPTTVRTCQIPLVNYTCL